MCVLLNYDIMFLSMVVVIAEQSIVVYFWYLVLSCMERALTSLFIICIPKFLMASSISESFVIVEMMRREPLALS